MFQPVSDHVGKIIVIDDDPNVGKLIARLLEKKGHEVTILLSGEEALKTISEEKFDIVITDIKLPGMDGMTVLEKIKRISMDIDVIMITGYGSIESAVSFMKAGALDYISKPINNEHLEIVIQKAVERKELIKAARERDLYLKMSLTDALTGLFNYKYFHEHLDRELYQCRRAEQVLSVMILDIDDFKKVNDRYGHQSGDRVLQQISSNLIKACRCHDTIARYGGEEFGIILPDTDMQRAEIVAERVLDIVKNGVYSTVDHPITISIGIANCPYHSCDKDELIKLADTALYHSKTTGKDRQTVYTDDFGRRQ